MILYPTYPNKHTTPLTTNPSSNGTQTPSTSSTDSEKALLTQSTPPSFLLNRTLIAPYSAYLTTPLNTKGRKPLQNSTRNPINIPPYAPSVPNIPSSKDKCTEDQSMVSLADDGRHVGPQVIHILGGYNPLKFLSGKSCPLSTNPLSIWETS